jgi:hypothetical protein
MADTSEKQPPGVVAALAETVTIANLNDGDSVALNYGVTVDYSVAAAAKLVQYRCRWDEHEPHLYGCARLETCQFDRRCKPDPYLRQQGGDHRYGCQV